MRQNKLLWIKGLIILSCMNCFAGEDQCPAMLNTPEEVKKLGELRVKSIKGWDRLFTWALSSRNHPYQLEKPLLRHTYHVKEEALQDFDLHYGYFSIYHPIVGLVTKGDRDIEVTQCLLNAIEKEIENPQQRRFSNEEVLAKVIAYRSLKKGMKIVFEDETYLVDEVIDLWRGMPAFGLLPEKGSKNPPILLFRGTDLDLISEKGWASILSDLDITGPGLTTFLRVQKRIHQWLKKAEKRYIPARAIGFSLGGALVLYTLIYENELINKEFPSIAFNTPGISAASLEKWNAIEKEKQPPLISYINQGDFVSRIGFLLPEVWEATLDHSMGVIEAHLTLISAQPTYHLTKVNVAKENKNR